MKNIIKIREELVKNGVEKNFSNMAYNFSECSSCQNGGDLGEIRHGDMIPEFEEAAFKLKIGELSEPVSTESGIHLILRTG